MNRYILEGHNPVPCPNIIEWVERLEKADRRVDKTKVGETEISTVFLGIDHSFADGPPLLFETLAFGGELDGEQELCSTWEQAEAQHLRMVRRAAMSKDLQQIVKLQIPLSSNTPNPGALVYNKDRSYLAEIPITKQIRRLLKDRLKIYVLATIKNGVITLSDEQPAQDW